MYHDALRRYIDILLYLLLINSENDCFRIFVGLVKDICKSAGAYFTESDRLQWYHESNSTESWAENAEAFAGGTTNGEKERKKE